MTVGVLAYIDLFLGQTLGQRFDEGPGVYRVVQLLREEDATQR